MNKTLFVALMLGTATMATAHTGQSQDARIQKLEQALAELKQEAEKERSQKQKDGKALRVPGTEQTIELILRPTLNVLGDVGQRGRDNFDISSISLKDVDPQHRGRGGFSMTPAGTRLGFRTNHDTANGPIKSHFEMDFNARSSAGRLKPRLRHAYITYNQFLAGQTATLFQDTSTMLDTVDLSGIMNGPTRQAQLRMAHKTASGFDLAVSLERPFTDVVWQGTSLSSSTPSSTGTTAYSEFASTTEGISTRGTYSQSTVPDAIVSVKYATPRGHIGVRGLARELKVKNLSQTATNAAGGDFKDRKTAYGVGVSGSLNMAEKITLVAQYNVGRGIGRYIPDAEGYSAYVDPTNKQMDLIRISHYMVGAKYNWNPDVSSNVMYQRINITPSRFMSNLVNNWNKKMDQVFVNTFFKVLPNTDLGLEYMFAERRALPSVSDNAATPAQPRGAKGTAHRVQMLVMYTF